MRNERKNTPQGNEVVARLLLDLGQQREGSRQDEIDSIVRYATEQNDDASSLLKIIDNAITLTNSRRGEVVQQNGHAILTGIEQYLSKPDIHCKELYPAKDARGMDQIEMIWRGIDAYFEEEKLADTYPNVSNFTKLAIVRKKYFNEKRRIPLAGKAIANSSDWLVALFPTTESVDPNDRSTAIQERESIYNILVNPLLGRDPNKRLEQIQKIPDDIFTIVKKHASNHPDVKYNIYTSQFGDVSLKDLYEASDQDTFNTKLMKYIISYPRGDEFWEAFIAEMFLNPESDVLHGKTTAKSSLYNPEYIKRVYGFHRYLFENIFDPAVTGQPTDHDFDEQVLSMVQKLGSISRELLPLMLKTVVGNAPFTAKFFGDSNESFVVEGGGLMDSINGVLIKYPPSLRRYIYDAMIQNIMTDPDLQIENNLQQRFGEHYKILYQRYVTEFRLGDLIQKGWGTLDKEIRRTTKFEKIGSDTFGRNFFRKIPTITEEHGEFDNLYTYQFQGVELAQGFKTCNLYHDQKDRSVIFSVTFAEGEVIGRVERDGSISFEDCYEVYIKRFPAIAQTLDFMLTKVIEEWRYSREEEYFEDSDIEAAAGQFLVTHHGQMSYALLESENPILADAIRNRYDHGLTGILRKFGVERKPSSKKNKSESTDYLLNDLLEVEDE